jgi:prepilin-type N-terminal cleavage/methylation domain-containing protein
MTQAGHTKGYTLLEMSVVLSIIAVLLGSIFIVQTLVRSSHMQTMLSEYDKYVKAVNEFNTKFLSLPGDMNNAESMWGSDLGGCPNTPANTVPKVATCDGNGDGKIGDSTTGGVLSDPQEWFRAWQHMSNAGFIQSSFTGAQGPGGAAEAVPTLNVPGSALSGAGFTLHYYLRTSDGALWADQYGHVMSVGLFTAGSLTQGPILSPDEALAIDLKIDDGKPGRGLVRAWRTSVLSGCTVSDTTQDAQAYSTVNSARSCSLVFLMGL